jgi:hypothetical protein
VTDFGFAGLFNHTASGLNLTLCRAYDPGAGRWPSRDPIGEDAVAPPILSETPVGSREVQAGGRAVSLPVAS